MDKSVNMKLKADLWKDISVKAAKEGITKREAVESALKLYLKK